MTNAMDFKMLDLQSKEGIRNSGPFIAYLENGDGYWQTDRCVRCETPKADTNLVTRFAILWLEGGECELRCFSCPDLHTHTVIQSFSFATFIYVNTSYSLHN